MNRPSAGKILLGLSGFALILSGCRVAGAVREADLSPSPTPPPPLAACAGLREPEEIPAEALAAYAGGKFFPIRSVVIEPGFGNPWDVYLCEKKISDPLAPLPEGRMLNLELGETPAPGSVFRREAAPGGGFFFLREPGPGGRFSARGTANSWVLEFTSWEAAPFDPLRGPAQIGGRASLRVAACFAGDPEIGDAGAAGVFADAIVRYLGNPD